MKTKSITSVLAILLLTSFALFGTKGVMAGELAEAAAKNPVVLKETIEHTEAAIASAASGDSAAALEHINGALASVKEINSEQNAAKIQKANGKIRSAWASARQAVKAEKNGNANKAQDFMAKVPGKLEAGLKVLNQISL